MRHHRIASSILLALALGGCSTSKDSSELVVTVWSDLAVPAEMDALRIQVTGTAQNIDRLFPLAADKRSGTYQIPVQLVLTQAGKGDLAIRVTATGSYQGIDIVSQEAVLSFLPDPARELVLDLTQSCKDVSCAAYPGYTCENGACARPVVVDPTTLPTYVPGQASPSPDAGFTSQPSDAASGTGDSVIGSGGVMGSGGSTGTINLDAAAGRGGSVVGSGGSGGVMGTGGTWGRATVDQALLIFGLVDVGVVSAPKTVVVTVTEAPVALNVTITGAGFAISANTCLAVQPVGTCTIGVVFAPTTAGAATGVLSVANVQVALSSTGTVPAGFAATPDLISLGTLLVGASAPAVVTIIPTGTVSSLSCLPAGADLTLASQTCPPAGMPVSAQCIYTFTFKATTVGDKVDTIVCSGGGKTAQTTVTAKVVTAPEPPRIVPSTQDFTARVGLSVAATFSLTNYGGSPTGILTAAVTGAGFSITSNDCVAPLAPLATCKIQVTFAPVVAGIVTGALTVTDATPGSMPAVAALTGTGIAGPTGVISPATRDFGTVDVGKSATTAFTITNGGAAASDIIALATTNPQFTIVSDLCGGYPLAPRTTCTFGVTFAPASAGLKQAIVNATQTSDGAVLGSAALTGTGWAEGPFRLTISPSTIDFGTTYVGGPVGPLVFTVINDGSNATGALTVLKNDSTSSVGGASQFKIASSTCAAALAPLATCQVGVTFDPTLVGSASAVIVVTDGTASTSPPATPSATLPGTVSGIAVPSISGLSAAPTWQEF
jgi:hypothetical protein